MDQGEPSRASIGLMSVRKERKDGGRRKRSLGLYDNSEKFLSRLTVAPERRLPIGSFLCG